jgi:branched-subunit amino acid ABC-type transport system permease component
MNYLNALVQGALLGGQYALFASGLSLMFGVLRVVNLAHGDLGILAAFGAMALLAAHQPVAVAVPIVLAGMAVVGVALHLGVLDRAMRQGAIPPMIATFGLSVAVSNLLQETFSANSRSIDLGSFGAASLHLGGLAVGWLPLAIFAVAVAVLVALHLTLATSRLGRAVRATADDSPTAALVGVDSRRIRRVSRWSGRATIAPPCSCWSSSRCPSPASWPGWWRCRRPGWCSGCGPASSRSGCGWSARCSGCSSAAWSRWARAPAGPSRRRS